LVSDFDSDFDSAFVSEVAVPVEDPLLEADSVDSDDFFEEE